MDPPSKQRVRMISTIDQARPSLISAIVEEPSVMRVAAHDRVEVFVALLGASDDWVVRVDGDTGMWLWISGRSGILEM